MHKVLMLCHLLYTAQVVCLLFPSYASTRDNRDEDDDDGNQNHNDGGDLKGDDNEGNKEEEISERFLCIVAASATGFLASGVSGIRVFQHPGFLASKNSGKLVPGNRVSGIRGL